MEKFNLKKREEAKLEQKYYLICRSPKKEISKE